MRKNQFLLIIGMISILLLTGCTNDNSTQSKNDNTITITQTSTKEIYNQKYANEAKQILASHENISKVVAANTDDLLIIAIEVPHYDRFKLAKLNTELSKKMDTHFKSDNIKVELATDKKIIWELEALEENLRKETITKKEFKKQLEHISKLLKEQT